MFLQLPAIPHTSRRTERTFWPAFQADYPRILGGVLDAIAGGLRELPSVNLKELPRMADYAEWGEAVGRGLGWGSEAFLATYNDNRKAATEAILEDSSVATLLLALGRDGNHWSGTTQKLYETITQSARHAVGARVAQRPLSKFGTELRRNRAPASSARAVHQLRAETRARIVTLHADSSLAAPASRPDEPRPMSKFLL